MDDDAENFIPYLEENFPIYEEMSYSHLAIPET